MDIEDYLKSLPKDEQDRARALLEQLEHLPDKVKTELENYLDPSDAASHAIFEEEVDGASGEYANPDLANILLTGVPHRVSFPVIFCYGDIHGDHLSSAIHCCQQRFHTLKEGSSTAQGHQDMAIMVYSYHWLCITLRFYYDETKNPDAFVFNPTGLRSHEGHFTVSRPRVDLFHAFNKKINVYTNIEELQYDASHCFVFCTEFLFNYARAERYLDKPFFEVIKEKPYSVIANFGFSTCRLPAYFRRAKQSFNKSWGLFSPDTPRETGPVSKKGDDFKSSVARYTTAEPEATKDGENTTKRVNQRIVIKMYRWWFKAIDKAVKDKLKEFPKPIEHREFTQRTRLTHLAQDACASPDIDRLTKAKIIRLIAELNSPLATDKTSLLVLFQFINGSLLFIKRISQQIEPVLFLFSSLDDLPTELLGTIRIQLIQNLQLSNDDAVSLFNSELMQERNTYLRAILTHIKLPSVTDSFSRTRILIEVLGNDVFPIAIKLKCLKQCLPAHEDIRQEQANRLTKNLCEAKLFEHLSDAELKQMRPYFAAHAYYSFSAHKYVSNFMATLLSRQNVSWTLVQRLLLLNLPLPAKEVNAIVDTDKTPAHVQLLIGLIDHCAQNTRTTGCSPIEVDMDAQAAAQERSATELGFPNPAALYTKPMTLLYVTEAHVLLATYFAHRRERKTFPIQFSFTLEDLASVVELELRSTEPKHTDDLRELVSSLPITDQRALCRVTPASLQARAHELRLWSSHLTRNATKKRERTPGSNARLNTTTTSSTPGSGAGCSTRLDTLGAGTTIKLDSIPDISDFDFDALPDLPPEKIAALLRGEKPAEAGTILDRDDEITLNSTCFFTQPPGSYATTTTPPKLETATADPSDRPTHRQRV